jgi:hypothetical protein
MSEEGTNPLLRPDDRFYRPPMVPDGQVNPFSDAANPPEPEMELPSAISYRPQYVAILPHRSRMNTYLAVVALSLNAGFLLYFFHSLPAYGWLWTFHWIFPVMAFVVSLAASWNSSGDVDAMENGAMDREGLRKTKIALWIGWGGFALSLSLMVLMLARAMGWIYY